ncbi:MAG: nitrous oxide reductase family maturation protein NosD [Proteobacteria bacterium]|nr:nitrous oxide reductase family maturation protein NosD [Pseudomonadota bacterium]MCP4919818.1 nitrous oxide reductase family maturation protein NosD [Pseudomonadota bacterium]
MTGLALIGGLFAAEITVGADAPTVDAALELAQAGDVVVLGPGAWPGPVIIDKPITLRSAGGMLVSDEGRTLVIRAPGVVVDQVVIQGSGDDMSAPDACIYVEPTGVGTVISNSELADCLFGIWLHEVVGARVVDNDVTGRPDVMEHSKGNGIHLFDSEQLVVSGNTVTGARDGIYVAATEDSEISGNTVSGQRFGIHYMYSYDNVIEDNVANDNNGGIALMGSLRLQVRGNVAERNRRHGILFRDVQYTTIENNRVENNVEGLFFFSSTDNVIRNNRIANNQIGARIWAGTVDNEVVDNAFIANREQIFYVASDDQEWGSNYWSDYMGWDQDGDGRGDRPYRNDALLAQLVHRYPAATLLLSSPALELLRLLQQRIPALRVPTVIDAHPLLSPPGGTA